MYKLQLVFAFFIAACNINAPVDHGIQFDGIYLSKIEDSASHVLRFYNDGTVIDGFTSETAEQMDSWLHRHNEQIGKARYAIDAGRIAFTTSGSAVGSIKYDGHIEGDKLLLRVTDLNTRIRNTLVFEFVPIKNLR